MTTVNVNPASDEDPDEESGSSSHLSSEVPGIVDLFKMACTQATRVERVMLQAFLARICL